ncbi:MAG: alpha-2-macroglobulin family protein, partial [Crocinitomicaceae bacterium]
MKFLLSILLICCLKVVSAQYRFDIKDYPADDIKYQRNIKDYNQFNLLVENGEYKLAFEELKRLENKAIKELKPDDFFYVLTRMDELLWGDIEIWSSDFDEGELQELVWKDAQKVEKLPFPLNAILHAKLAGRIEMLEINQLLSFDDESLIWKINNETKKIKNGTFQELVQYHSFQSINRPRDLMKISAANFNDSSSLNQFEALQQYMTLFELLADRFLSDDDAQNKNTDLNCFGKTDDLLKINDFYSKENFNYQLFYHIEKLHAQNKRWDAYAFWVAKRLNEAFNSNDNYSKELMTAYHYFEKELENEPASNLFTLLYCQKLCEKAGQYDWQNNTEVKTYYIDALALINASLKKFPFLMEDFFHSHPSKKYATQLLDLKEYIENGKSLQVKTKGKIILNKPFIININSKNTSQAFLKVYHYDKINPNYKGGGTYFSKYEFSEVYSNELKLYVDSFHHEHTKDFLIPSFSKAGDYLFIVAEKETNIDSLKSKTFKNFVNFFTIHFSNIEINTKVEGKEFQLLVTNNLTGKPIENASVTIKKDFYLNDNSPKKTLNTNKLGLVTFKLESSSYLYTVQKDDDSLTKSIYYSNSDFKLANRPVNTIYTDRAIYRPGQKMYVKVLGFIQNNGADSLESQGRIGVALKDGNGKILCGDFNLFTNEYGSAETSFVLPRDGFMLGECYLSIDNGFGYGEKTHVIRIEEYKRPTFEVKFDEIQGNIKLGETLHLTGKATAFSGFPIGNASVRIKIEQRNYFPTGCSVPYVDQDYLSSFFETTSKTNENGEFQLDFLPLAKQQTYGAFFNIDAIVTDVTGESQSVSRSLYVGNKRYSISASIDRNLIASNENSFPIRVMNSEGQEVKTAKLSYRLIRNNKEHLYESYIEKAEFSEVNQVEFEKEFPYVSYNNVKEVRNELSKAQGEINSGDSLNLTSLIRNEAGNYTLILNTTDEIGAKTETTFDFNWINLKSTKGQHKSELWTHSSTKSARIGDEIIITIGSSFKKQPIFIELANEENILIQNWTILKNRHKIKYTVTNKDLHGLTFNCIMSKNGQSYKETIVIDVPDHSKELNLKLETVRDFLRPGEKEKWNVLINNDETIEKNAELLVGMYDASLDKIQANSWGNEFFVRYHKQERWGDTKSYNTAVSNYLFSLDSHYTPYLPEFSIMQNYKRITDLLTPRLLYCKVATKMADIQEFADSNLQIGYGHSEEFASGVGSSEAIKTYENQSSPRRNFDETAFFYPSVYADQTGKYRFEFTVPDAFSKWRFMAMAHTKDFKSGYYEHSFEAKKELMIEPNEPRFLREGDHFVFSSKVVNLSDKEQDITTRLKLFDPLTNEVISSAFGDFKDQKVIVKSNGSTEVSWELTIPTNLYSLIAYEISASNENFSDIERKAIPILSNRMLVTTSKSFAKTTIGEETFTLDKINQLSPTAEKVAISLEMHTQPLWTILMSLPYLMEYPYECSEQTFSRFYANSTALSILNSHPEFQAIIESWKTTDPSAFLSELDKNPDLKSIILSETPWVVDAQNETAQRNKLAFLFDKNNLLANIENAQQKLMDLQTADGGWAWYGGKEANIYITQHIVTGLRELQDRGELQFASKDPNSKSILTALNDANEYLENYYTKLYDNLKPEEIKNHLGLSALHIQWLYSIGGYEYDKNVMNYYDACLRLNWTKFNLQTQAIAGLYALKVGNSELATKIKKSLLQRAINKPDLGMYWKENKAGYNWNEAPVETQAYLIQFFGKFPELQKEVRQMQLWLMQHKRTNSWESTRATTLACMSLFINSGIKSNQLQQVVKVKFADGTNLGILKKESASNFKFTGKEATNSKGTITVETQTESPVFGSIYLQYTDLIDKAEKSTGDIRLERHFYLSNEGVEKEILPNSILPIGTIVKVKLKIVSNQSMEFVHLKDGKGAGFEAREALSAYRYNSVGYYQVNKDASTEIFIDYLPKGTHQFEYEVIASGKGIISVGAAEVECMYAPSFRANSGGFK